MNDLTRPEFPRSNGYDAAWMMDNQMGPNALWLVEWLTQRVDLQPGARVLDLGCGRAMTSIFLAKEFGARVWAADLWMSPDHNWRRVVAAGVADLVCPVKAEAHAIPFAAGFFDAVISVDAYHYFGTDQLYLSYLANFVREGGTLGVVVPGLTQPLGDGVPEHLTRPQGNGKPFWEEACCTFHTAEWWGQAWRACSQVTNVVTDTQADGWRHWRDFDRAVEAAGKNTFPSDHQALDHDGGRFIGFVRMVARRTSVEAENLYDGTLGARVGVDT
jgi:cyclopropane fatty-acyl-phospholipid synthase-like methyltransferase